MFLLMMHQEFLNRIEQHAVSIVMVLDDQPSKSKELVFWRRPKFPNKRVHSGGRSTKELKEVRRGSKVLFIDGEMPRKVIIQKREGEVGDLCP